jgi:hypothetical protein
VKFKAFYMSECSRIAGVAGQGYSFMLAFASTSCVAAWAVWQRHPAVWAWIVAIAQVFHIGRPYVPFLKHEKDFLEMSFEFDVLYLDYERLWFAFENGQVNEQTAERRFYGFREREIDIEKAHKHVHTPRFRWVMERAQERTYTALGLNFPVGDSYE